MCLSIHVRTNAALSSNHVFKISQHFPYPDLNRAVGANKQHSNGGGGVCRSWKMVVHPGSSFLCTLGSGDEADAPHQSSGGALSDSGLG